MTTTLVRQKLGGVVRDQLIAKAARKPANQPKKRYDSEIDFFT